MNVTLQKKLCIYCYELTPATKPVADFNSDQISDLKAGRENLRQGQTSIIALKQRPDK